jgi:type I restriction enzyme S subunit
MINDVDPPPDGWALPKLADIVAQAQSGFASGEKALPNGFQHLRMNNIGEEGALVLNLLRTVPPELVKTQHRLQINDVLVCTTNSGKLVGKCALFDQEGEFAFSNHITRLRPHAGVIDAKYLRWSLWLIWKAGRYDEFCQHWVNQSTLPKDALLAMPIPLPPLAEQKRIVAKVDQIFTRVNAARDRLAKAPAILKRFRQSVLAAACSGRLTADWRERNATDNGANQILGEIQKLRRHKPPAVRDDLPQIPESWVWANFGYCLSELRNGIATKPQMKPPGNPILRINAIRPGRVLYDDLRYLPNSDHLLKTFTVRNRDLFFTRYNGSIELLGVCGMVRDLPVPQLLYPDKLMRVRFDHQFLSPEYAEVFFQAPTSRDRMMDRAKSSAGQQGISGKDIKEQPIALPPPNEQAEIVRRVTKLLKLADQIELRVTAARTRADRLIQATLAKAFRGELVPTEAELARQQGLTFEPADQLLARIRSTAPLPASRRPRFPASSPRPRKRTSSKS